MKSLLGRLGLLAVASMLALVASEALVRVAVDPVDYLVPRLVDDPVLRHRVDPGTGGHDAWGFRNRAVPDRVDVVTIGDSQTYGWAARASEAWPAWLARLTDSEVYNLGMGGYGPLEYLHLLERRALRLDPSIVIVGLYLGNDLSDAHYAAYGVDRWRDWRNPTRLAERESFTSRAVSSASATPRSPGARARDWLRRHSVLYRLFVFSVEGALRPLQVRYLSESSVETTPLHDPEGRLMTVLDPLTWIPTLDLADPRVEEGLQLTLRALAEMDRISREAGVELLVVVIPTKIRVFDEYRRRTGDSRQADAFEALASDERRATSRIEAWLCSRGIRHVDVLSSLRRAVGEEAIYPRDWNGHPNGKGYRIIAEAVAEFVRPSSAAAAWRMERVRACEDAAGDGPLEVRRRQAPGGRSRPGMEGGGP